MQIALVVMLVKLHHIPDFEKIGFETAVKVGRE